MNASESRLQHGSVAKGVGDDLAAVALFDEQAFKQICGSHRPAVRHWESQVRNGSLQAVHKAAGSTLLLPAIGGHDAYCEFVRNRAARSLVSRLQARLAIRTDILPHLGQVSHAVRQAAPGQ